MALTEASAGRSASATYDPRLSAPTRQSLARIRQLTATDLADEPTGELHTADETSTLDQLNRPNVLRSSC